MGGGGGRCEGGEEGRREKGGGGVEMGEKVEREGEEAKDGGGETV